VTFSKLKERVDWMAIQYYIRGWEQGEMVAVFMPNIPLFTITCLGAAKIGVPFTIVDPSASPISLQHQLKDSRALYIVTTAALLPVVRQVTVAMRGLKEILVLDKVEEPKETLQVRFTIEMKYNLLLGKPPGWGALPDWTVKPTDTALIHYGPAVKGDKPKGLVISHGHLIKNALQAEAVLGSLSKADVLLSAVPYFNLDAWTLVNNLAIHKGAKSVTLLAPTLVSFLEAVTKHQVTIARVSSAILAELAAAPKTDLGSLTRVFADVTLDRATETSLKKNYPKLAINNSYAAPNLIALEAGSGKKDGGLALLPGTQAKIVDDAGKELGADKEGNLYIKGDQVSAGYFHSEDTTKARFDKDGFFNTLAKAKADKEGLLTITPPKPGADE